ncbi:hypothetical protein Fmac_032942 [Flemingia macrophylla]|uniref:Uncharacterized protein n=1 Tax=Flemingia macrophylla TaxID=520843 RepID=A0ABD1L6E3_9FABA
MIESITPLMYCYFSFNMREKKRRRKTYFFQIYYVEYILYNIYIYIYIYIYILCDLHVTYVFKSLNIKWREHRQELWQQMDDGTRNGDQLIAMVPEGLNKDQWASFVDYRLDSKTKELECGRKVSRGEIWIATHKHANGEFVNEEAKEIGEKIKAYELSGNVSKDISSQDSLAQTLGSQEHCGRVRR